MPFDDRIIDQVRSVSDIVSIISEYVSLKRAGRTFKACCPFHQEKTPSFIVNPERQSFHCFGCSEGGDVFAFLMKHEQMNFPEALRMLADRAHITLPESQGKKADRSENEFLYEMYEAAQAYYHTQFLKAEAAQGARAYWKSRGFSEKQGEEFGIGYAQDDWRKLFEYLSQKGFKQELLMKSGLVQRSQQGHLYDLFRSRLMFPIRNAQGKVIAFGGRVMGDGMPKYLNSPETPIFSKRRELYGLYTAKKSFSSQNDIRRLLVTEGYMDCLQLQANGFANTVATLGTALTNDHVRLIKRYADEAIVVYDGDKAGEQAALRGLDVFLEESMSVKVISLPMGFDPDDFIRKNGPTALQTEVDRAADFFDFKLKVLLNQFSKADSLGLLKITSEFLESIAKLSNPVLVDRYLKRLAGTLGVEERSLRSELTKLKSKQPFHQERAREKSQNPQTSDVPMPPNEKLLLALILHFPPYLEQLKSELKNYEPESDQAKIVFRLIETEMHQTDDAYSHHTLMTHTKDPKLKRLISELLVMDWHESDRDKAFLDCLARIKKESLEHRLKKIRSEIGKAESSGDSQAVSLLMKQYQDAIQDSQAPSRHAKN